MIIKPEDAFLVVKLPEATASKLKEAARLHDMTPARMAGVLLSDVLERDRPLTYHSKETR